MGKPGEFRYTVGVQENGLIELGFEVYPTAPGAAPVRVDTLVHVDQASKLINELSAALAEAKRRLGIPG